MNITATLAQELGIKIEQVEATLKLLDEGDSVPFIARYRKEITGSLDDVTLRNLSERLEYLKGLEERRKSILDSIQEQGKLTPELQASIEAAGKLSELENLYRPYKKKRKTKASIAKEAGLGPLAQELLDQNVSEETYRHDALRYVNPGKGIASAEDALQGASDIVAEMMADVPHFYDDAKAYIEKSGRLESKETKDDIEKKYASYAAFSCPVRQVKNYQTLALNRGEKEKGLSVCFAYDKMTMINLVARAYLKPRSSLENEIRSVAEDAYKRLIAPTVENDIRGELSLKAEDASILLFKDNLKQLLLGAPLKGKRILGFDPAFVNGCKLATVDESGKLLHVDVIYPTVGGAGRIEESRRILLSYLKQDRIDYIALGNGTASRESEAFIKETLQSAGLAIPVVIVNEAGASVYSASPLGTEEFPELHVEKRSAISLARRLQDPLSELVKIDPEAMGVGQYQHDMDQKKLSNALNGVVEDSVNEVGVYLNSASYSLLKYVSGIGPSLAKGIVDYRNENGPFKSRKDLHKVPKLGPKAFEQCAGFLRIADGYPLDNTAVHPESYPCALALLKELGLSLDDLGTAKASVALSSIKDLQGLSTKIGVGKETLSDIVSELQKPGRDPREEAHSATLDNQAKDIKDLRPGMILNGTVRNIVDFGVFVDIGVHQDGLVHISELSDTRVSSPLEVVHVNEIIQVKVLSVDLERKRIGLSLKQAKKETI
jgi:protein Tex